MDENDALVDQLLKDLEIPNVKSLTLHSTPCVELRALLKLPRHFFEQVAFDLALLAGTAEDWELSLKVLSLLLKLQVEYPKVNHLKLWQLRCLYELKSYSEVLIVVNNNAWNSSDMLHVNYLAGMAYFALGMNEEARQRFGAVKGTDATYQSVAQWLAKL